MRATVAGRPGGSMESVDARTAIVMTPSWVLGEQLCHSVLVGADVSQRRDGAKRGVRRHERVRADTQGCGRQHRVERSHSLAASEDLQAVVQLLGRDRQKGRQKVRIVIAKRYRVRASATPGADVYELLDHLRRGRGLDLALGHGGDQTASGIAQWMFCSLRVNSTVVSRTITTRGDRAARPARCAALPHGHRHVGCGEHPRPAALRRASGLLTPRSIASRTTVATDTPRSRATFTIRSWRSSSSRICSRCSSGCPYRGMSRRIGLSRRHEPRSA